MAIKAKLFVIFLLAMQLVLAKTANADNGLHTVVGDTATIRLNESSAMQIETSGVISLTKGEALISATKQTVVKSGNYMVNIPSGSIVLVVANDDALTVTSLWSSTAAAVLAYIGKKVIPVSAGQEIIIGNDLDHVTKILKSDNIARREVRLFELSKSDAVSTSEVSLVSVINNTRILSRMLASSDASDRALIGKLKKMAACLNQTTANHGPYSAIGKP